MKKHDQSKLQKIAFNLPACLKFQRLSMVIISGEHDSNLAKMALYQYLRVYLLKQQET